jgi:hypothetical protein
MWDDDEFAEDIEVDEAHIEFIETIQLAFAGDAVRRVNKMLDVESITKNRDILLRTQNLDEDQGKEFIEQMIQRRVTRSKQHSRYDPPEFHEIMKRLAINAAAPFDRVFGAQLGPRPLFATLASNSMNALVMLPEHIGRPIIFFDIGAFTFLNQFAKIIARIFETRLSVRLFDGIWADPLSINAEISEEDVEKFIDIVVCHVVFKDPNLSKPYVVGPERQRTVDFVRHAMELFVFSHERAHHSLGHLAGSEMKPLHISEDPSPGTVPPALEEVNFGWKQEYEADAGALKTMLQPVQLREQFVSSVMLTWAVLNFFFCFEAVEKARAILDNRSFSSDASDTHPDSASRRRNLIDCYLEMFEPVLREHVAFALDGPVAASAALFEGLLARSRTRLEQLDPALFLADQRRDYWKYFDR